jgi:hypothetical protein
MFTPRPFTRTLMTGLVGASLLFAPLVFAQATSPGSSGMKTEQTTPQAGSATTKKAAQVKGEKKKPEEKAPSSMH